MTSPSFLDARERADFASSHIGRRYASQSGGKTTGIGGLVAAALARGSGLVAEQKVVAIKARAGQGLTWAAEEALGEVARADPPWKRIVTLDGNNALGTMLEASGWRTVCRALRPHAVAVGGGARIASGLAVLLLTVSVAAFCGSAWLAAAATSFLAAGPLLLVAAAVICAAGWWLVSRGVRAGALTRLAWILGDPGLGEAAAAAAGVALGRELTRAQVFTVLVVDDYSRLPAPARTAILEALRAGGLDYAVTWLILDGGSPGLLQTDLARLRESDAGGVSVSTCELQPLSGDERARLARAGGVPAPRARTDEELFAALAKNRGTAAEVVDGPPKSRGPRAAA